RGSLLTLGLSMEKVGSTVQCDEHGTAQEAFICEHLLSHPKQLWCSREPTEENPWPDAWCLKCDEVQEKNGGWNSESESKISIKLVCSECYASLRAQSDPWEEN